MSNPPRPKHVLASQAELRALYEKHKFGKKLPQCEQIILADRRRRPEDTFHSELFEHEHGIKYRDPKTHESVAVIYTYTDIAGKKHTTIRMLRVGNIIYDAKAKGNQI